MKTMSFEDIEKFVLKGYTLLKFTGCGKNYVGIRLLYDDHGRKNFRGRAIYGRVYNIESLRVLYKIYQVTKPIKLKYDPPNIFNQGIFFLFIEGLDAITGDHLDQKFFDKASRTYQEQREILNRALSE